jgi:glycosyltransferase involved in cell wall biosynthesis
MSIIIFGDLFSFPEGNAATNRVHTYAKGFLEYKQSTRVICFAYEYHSQNEGKFDGIHYYYPFNRSIRNRLFLIRRWQKLQIFSNTISIITKINRQEKIIAINVWTNSFLTFIFAYYLTIITKSKLIVECSEHPLRNYQHNFVIKFLGRFKFYIEAWLSDGIICISRYLIDLYREIGISENKLILIPSTVDPSRFQILTEQTFSFSHIAYFGSLTFKRDSINTLINAFSLIARKYPDVSLVLGGFCSEYEKREITNLISKLGLNHQIKIIEYLPRQEIIRYMQHASVLIMVRSNDLEAKASYPSKLTEYLSTGIPVITVKVGEISDFLQDGINAYLVEPEDSNGLANKIEYVLNNNSEAIIVGENGRKLTETIFNYKVQTRRILDFIQSLNPQNMDLQN